MPALHLTLPDPFDFDGIIFDCDGTLVDSMPLHWRAWRAALQAHGAPFDFTLEMHHQYAGMSIPEIIRACNARFGCSVDPGPVEADREAWFFDHLHELQPVPEVVAIARQWHGKLPLAVASGSARTVVVRELDLLGLSPLFSAMVTPEDVQRSKPAPDLFLLAAARLGVRPERCLVFEDGANGITAATAAGMASVYVPTND